jgi:hypothetical protein
MMSEETVGRFRQLIPYEGETAEELEEILKDDTAIAALAIEEELPFYITLVKNGDAYTVNFTSTYKHLSLREFVHLCRRNLAK